ncbi:MAG: hypothetical protein AAB658_16760, partial [Chloroflexota bacterium]
RGQPARTRAWRNLIVALDELHDTSQACAYNPDQYGVQLMKVTEKWATPTFLFCRANCQFALQQSPPIDSGEQQHQ